MSLKLRRGTSADRTTVTPAEGELIYTTDTKLVYVGDGATAGGNLLSGGGSGSGTVSEGFTGKLAYYASNGTTVEAVSGMYWSELNDQLMVDGSLKSPKLVSAGSIHLEPSTGIVYVGNLDGSVSGNLYVVKNGYGSNISDGVVFSQHHSTTDAVNLSLYRTRGTSNAPTAVVNTDELAEIAFFGYDGTNPAVAGLISVDVSGSVATGRVPGRMRFGTTNTSGVTTYALSINASGSISVTDDIVINGDIFTPSLRVFQNVISTRVSNADLELRGNATGGVVLETIRFGGGTISTTDSSGLAVVPATTFYSDVNVGNDVRVTNRVFAREFSSTASTSPLISSATSIDLTVGTKVKVNNGLFRVARLTQAQRDLITPENGDLVYNTDTNKFQGFENGIWVNLI